MQPYYQDDLVTLYCADYCTVAASYNPGEITTVITDPPFNAGKDFENDNLSPLAFRAFCNRFALELYRLQPENILVEVGKDDSTMRQELERYFEYKYSICLNYTNSMRNGAIGYANWGLVLWFSNGGKCYQRYKDRLDSTVHSTIGEFKHPSPKEVTHYRQLIRMFTPPSGVIFDPFCGSGTTLRAAKDLGIHAIGVDLKATYCEIAARRMAQESMLFT